MDVRKLSVNDSVWNRSSFMLMLLNESHYGALWEGRDLIGIRITDLNVSGKGFMSHFAHDGVLNARLCVRLWVSLFFQKGRFCLSETWCGGCCVCWWHAKPWCFLSQACRISIHITKLWSYLNVVVSFVKMFLLVMWNKHYWNWNWYNANHTKMYKN